MNRKYWIKAALITLIAVLIAPAALAGHKTRVVVPAPRLDLLAHDLLLASRDVRVEAVAAARHPSARRGLGRIDGGVIGALTTLERQADQFLFAVQRRSPRRVEQEYFQLLRAFDRASFEVEGVRSPHVRREFRDVAILIQRVAQRVELAAGYGPGHPRYERFRDGVHGTIVLGDVIGNADLRIRVDW